MAIRLITVDTSTGNVVCSWMGGDDQTLAPVAGRTHIPVDPEDPRDYSRQRWDGTAFEPIHPAPVRVITPLDFARRFSMAEDTAIDVVADADRTVKAWMRRLTLAHSVDLDHQDVIAGLAHLKSVGIPSVWADTATADRRIREIRR